MVSTTKSIGPVRLMYFVRIGLLFFYMWEILLFKSLIFIVRTKKIRTIPEMRTSGCLFNCYFCNRSLFMADHTMIMIICFWVEMIIIISYEWFSWQYSFIKLRVCVYAQALFLCLKFIHFFRVFCSLSFNICHSFLPIFSSLLHKKKTQNLVQF